MRELGKFSFQNGKEENILYIPNFKWHYNENYNLKKLMKNVRM